MKSLDYFLLCRVSVPCLGLKFDFSLSSEDSRINRIEPLPLYHNGYVEETNCDLCSLRSTRTLTGA